MKNINVKDYIESGTKKHIIIGWIILIITLPIAIVVSYGILLAVFIVWVVTKKHKEKILLAQLNATHLKVTNNQFPEIYNSVEKIAVAMGLTEIPEIFISESNSQNAMAFKHGSVNAIVLIDDIIWGATRTKNNEIINFILAHELAHHALGHVNLFRSLITSRNGALSRLDEYSADAVAAALVGKDNSKEAMQLLLIGPQLFDSVNVGALERQALDCMNNKYTKKAEGGAISTHPFLLSRYSRFVK